MNLTRQYLIVSNNHNMQDADHNESQAVCYHFQTKAKEKLTLPLMNNGSWKKIMIECLQ